MFNFPGNDGLVFDYQTEEMLNILWTLGIFEMIVFGIMVVMLILRCVVNPKSAAVSSQPNQSETQSEQPLIQPRRQATSNYDVFLVVSSILFYVLLIMCTISFGVLHGFEKLGRTIPNKTWYAAVIAASGIILHIFWKYITSASNAAFVQKARSLRGRKIVFYAFVLLVWLTFVGLMFYAMNGVCYCIYNDSFGDYQLSTSLSRRYYLDGKICPGKSICQIYATLPETTSSSVFINIHTGIDVESLDSNMTFGPTTVVPTDLYVFTPRIDEQFAERKVWTLLFDNLNASTLYNLTVTTGESTINTTYKTLPVFGDINTSVKMLMGGDIGLTPEGREIFEVMANESADLLIIGGDVTYDNAMTYCYYPWDKFYQLIDKINKRETNSSRLIPFILAVGNHDVGYNGLAHMYTFPRVDGPWWFAYHPQHFAENNRSIPRIEDRKSYGYHIIGSTVMVTLDSGYMETYEDQGAYLEAISANFSAQNYIMMAVYHVPLYPSCFHELPTHGQSKQALKLSLQYYEPLFIKYKFKLCLENHVHKFKRTIPISGVVYIGDGNLGVDAVECPIEYRISDSVLASKKYVDSNHYWLGMLYTNRIELSGRSRHNATEIDSAKIPFM